MADSTVRGRARKVVTKPQEPYPDFPLFLHATGRWAKENPWQAALLWALGQPDGALQRYVDQWDDRTRVTLVCGCDVEAITEAIRTLRLDDAR